PVRGRARGSARADREVLFRVKLSARWPSADAIPLWTIGTSPGPPAAPSRPPAALAWTRHGHRQFADSGPKALAARALLPAHWIGSQGRATPRGLRTARRSMSRRPSAHQRVSSSLAR